MNYAALRVLDGAVLGACRPTRDTKEFVRFLDRIEGATPADQTIHVILDNLSTHKSPPVHHWLRRHPRVHFHFIPTSSSWLNLVERWFGDITRERIRRGTSRASSISWSPSTAISSITTKRPDALSGPRTRTPSWAQLTGVRTC